MRWLVLAAAAAAASALAQTQALLSPGDMNELCVRSMQLMEAGGVAIPDLERAAAPVIENVRLACTQLQAVPASSPSTYVLMMNLRAYLSLADAVPKPFPFPDVARQQLAELRDQSTRLDSHFRALLGQKEGQLRTADRDNLNRYAEANGKLPPIQPGNPRVVFLGDSITDLWRLNEYFPDHDFVNRGIRGQISGEMLGRMKADVIDLHPQAVLILAGTNDLARGIPVSIIQNNYVMLADLASAYKIKVIFASVLPVSDYHKDESPANERTPARPPALIRALNEWLSKFCSERGYTYLNYFPAMVDETGQLKADLGDDGLHPNSKGYRIMAPLALEAIQKTVRMQEAPQKPRKRGRLFGTSK